MHEHLLPASAPEKPVQREVKTSREKRLPGWLNKFLRISAISMLALASADFRPPRPAFAQEELPKGKIVYMSDEKGERGPLTVVYSDGRINEDGPIAQFYDVVVSNPDGSEKKNLTTDIGAPALGPRWLPDGKRVIFVVARVAGEKLEGTIIANAQTAGLELLPGTQNWFEVEPTQKGIVYSYLGEGDNTNLAFVPYDSKEKMLGPTALLSAEEIDVSSGGESLLFRFTFIDGRRGLAITSLERFLRGTEEPLLLSQGIVKDAVLARWSNSGEWVVFTAPVPPNIENTIYKMRKDGTEIQRLTPGIEDFYLSLGSFTPGDKYIVFSSYNPGSESQDLFIVPSSGGEARVLFETPWNELWPDWQPAKEIAVFPEARKRLVLIPGLTGYISTELSAAGIYNLFVDFESRIRKLGYSGEDFIHMSWAGWEVGPENGLYYPQEQVCEDTLTPPEERAQKLIDFWISWFAQHPNDQLIAITHSEAVQPAIMAMEIVREQKEKNPNYPIDPGKIDLIFTHPASLGVDKPHWELIGRRISVVCKPLPSPGLFSYPAGENLASVWDNRQIRAKEIEEVINWWIKQGGKAASVGNSGDLILGAARDIMKIATALTGVNVPGYAERTIETQKVPATSIHILSLGFGRNEDLSGHEAVWRTEKGLSLLEQLVGNQIK